MSPRELRKNRAAFLRSSWSAKHGERTGKLQELMANFAQRGAELIQSITAGITAGFNLLAMLAVAVAVSPWASIAALVVLPFWDWRSDRFDPRCGGKPGGHRAQG